MKDTKKWPEENPQMERFLMYANNIVAGRFTNVFKWTVLIAVYSHSCYYSQDKILGIEY